MLIDEQLDKLAWLLIGWLLGLLAPAITDAIKRRYENKLGREAFLGELRELAPVLATAAFGARNHLGLLDRQFLQWTKDAIERFPSLPNHQDVLESLQRFLANTDDQLLAMNRYLGASNKQAKVLQHYPVPLLDARVSALWSFDTEFQRNLLVILRNIALLDDVVDRSRHYFEMTFAYAESDNHKLIVENLDQTYQAYAERAVIIVDQIKALKTDRN